MYKPDVKEVNEGILHSKHYSNL